MIATLTKLPMIPRGHYDFECEESLELIGKEPLPLCPFAASFGRLIPHASSC